MKRHCSNAVHALFACSFVVISSTAFAQGTDNHELQALPALGAVAVDGPHAVPGGGSSTFYQPGDPDLPPGFDGSAVVHARLGELSVTDLGASGDDGVIVGSVSGGCVEDDMIERVRTRDLVKEKPVATRYGVTEEQASRAGLPPPRMQVFRVERPAPAHSACSYPVILQWIPVSEGEVRARDAMANLL